ncbi:MAG: AMP-binding protein, partial [Actinomycetota bacterium]
MAATPYFETTLTRDRIEAMTGAGHWPNDLLIDRLADRLAGREDQPLIVDRGGAVTWGAFAADVERLARGLLAIGLRPGQVVQLQLPNRREFPLAVLACERVGLVVNPVAPIFRHHEVSVMSQLAKPTAVITVGSFRGFGLAAMHTELRESAPWLEHVIVVDDDPGSPGPGTTDSAHPADLPADVMPLTDVLAAGDASPLTDDAIELLRPN